MAETKMQLVDWLDDLCVRFIINLPTEELDSMERICFQVEEAQWFYEDFIRPLDPTLPSINLRQFCMLLFRHFPLTASFPEELHERAFAEFLAYKTRVPVRGAIILNETMDEVLLVKGWKKGASWSFPRGKINKDERDLDCAVREVYEETGFDLAAAGLVEAEEKTKSIEVTMREQHMKLFVFTGVPKETSFAPRTRKEISKIEWYKLTSLPGYSKKKQHANDESVHNASRMYMVAPFIGPLKKWIAQQKQQRGNAVHFNPQPEAVQYPQDTQSAIQLSIPVNPPEDVHQDFVGATPQVHHSIHSQALPTSQGPPLDISAQLRGLLGVGQPHQPVAEVAIRDSSASKSANLLALLQNKPQTISQPGIILPQTPIEQVAPPIPTPASPHHHNGYPQPFSSFGVPTGFPIRPSHSGLDIHQSAQFRAHSPQRNHVISGWPGPADVNTNSTYATLNGYPSQNLHAGRMSQQMHHPQSSAPMDIENKQFHSVPPASQLPVPRLSNHAQSLLNAFKTNPKPASPAVPMPVGIQRSISSQAPILAEQPSSSQAARANPVANLAPPNRNEALLNLLRSGPTQNSAPASNPAQPSQNALLSLFRPPPAAAPSLPEQRLEPAEALLELPAATSPNAHGLKTESADKIVEKRPRDRRNHTGKSHVVANPSQTPRTPNSGPVLTTNSSPLNDSESGTVRRKPKPSRGQAAQTEKPAAFTILKRPVEADAPSALPSVTTAENALPISSMRESTPAAEQPQENVTKPFQPQILRRPRIDDAASLPRPTSNSGKEVVTPPTEATKPDHKGLLLSLFSKPKQVSEQRAASPPVVSPVSVDFNRGLETRDVSEAGRWRTDSTSIDVKSPTVELSRSRINSIASAPRPSSVKPFERSGASTPMSPMDRGFLLNFLDGVVKNAGTGR